MRIYCDTSVLVAAVIARHPHYGRARPLLERIAAREVEAWISAHSLGECYAVFTSLPLFPRIAPSEARLIIERSLKPHFCCVTADEAMYLRAVERCERAGAPGGAIYDALLVECAHASSCERLYTFNLKHFQRLDPEWAERITAP